MQVKNSFLKCCIALLILAMNQVVSAAPTSSTFLSIADVHFDPFITCVAATTCPLVTELEQAPVTQWHGILATHDTQLPQYKQDSNFILLSQL